MGKTGIKLTDQRSSVFIPARFEYSTGSSWSLRLHIQPTNAPLGLIEYIHEFMINCTYADVLNTVVRVVFYGSSHYEIR